KSLDPFTLNLSVNLEPLYSIILAWFFFGEAELFSPGFILGTLIILSALVVHTRYKWKLNSLTSQ
ncbi:MAG: EamA/RhaT family transporter, partial [Bacteroidota bacterium]